MGVGILAKRVVLELGSSTNFVYSLREGARAGWRGHLLFYFPCMLTFNPEPLSYGFLTHTSARQSDSSSRPYWPDNSRKTHR